MRGLPQSFLIVFRIGGWPGPTSTMLFRRQGGAPSHPGVGKCLDGGQTGSPFSGLLPCGRSTGHYRQPVKRIAQVSSLT